METSQTTRIHEATFSVLQFFYTWRGGTKWGGNESPGFCATESSFAASFALGESDGSNPTWMDLILKVQVVGYLLAATSQSLFGTPIDNHLSKQHDTKLLMLHPEQPYPTRFAQLPMHPGSWELPRNSSNGHGHLPRKEVSWRKKYSCLRVICAIQLWAIHFQRHIHVDEWLETWHIYTNLYKLSANMQAWPFVQTCEEWQRNDQINCIEGGA